MVTINVSLPFMSLEILTVLLLKIGIFVGLDGAMDCPIFISKTAQDALKYELINDCNNSPTFPAQSGGVRAE